MDAICFSFQHEKEGLNKNITLHNYNIPDFGKIPDISNSQLSRHKRYISFDDFNTREEFKKKNSSLHRS